VSVSQPAAGRDELLQRALEQPWYHTIELAPGKATSGAVDLRRTAPRVLPEDLAGLRALDVGTFDGFWAFELEKRGADVLAADLDSYEQVDLPPHSRERLVAEGSGRTPGERFGLARELLDSKVQRVASSIYDLDTVRLGGQVDFALIGALLLHLRDPVGGLERVRGVLGTGGRLLLVEPFSVPLTLLRPRRAAGSFQAAATDFNWWLPNLSCLRDWLRLAGFGAPRRRAFFRLQAVRPMRQWYVALEASVEAR
jgi:SAM-dependent methyltransferase